VALGLVAETNTFELAMAHLDQALDGIGIIGMVALEFFLALLRMLN
jgi:hypothetical protein